MPQRPTPSTVAPRSTHESYHPGGYGVSEGLKRARRPFLVKNTLTGGAIMGFAVGVYYYSISQVKQDDFSSSPDARAPGAGAGGAASTGGSTFTVPGSAAASTSKPPLNISSTPCMSADDERRAQILRAQGRLV